MFMFLGIWTLQLKKLLKSIESSRPGKVIIIPRGTIVNNDSITLTKISWRKNHWILSCRICGVAWWFLLRLYVQGELRNFVLCEKCPLYLLFFPWYLNPQLGIYIRGLTLYYFDWFEFSRYNKISASAVDILLTDHSEDTVQRRTSTERYRKMISQFLTKLD